jgi:hypothetical protein
MHGFMMISLALIIALSVWSSNKVPVRLMIWLYCGTMLKDIDHKNRR